MAKAPKHSTRESWLHDAGEAILSSIILPAIKDGPKLLKAQPRWQVACGWPSARAVSHTRKRIGECWDSNACSDGATNHIFISPALDQPLEVLETLAHELIHMIVGGACKHKGLFRTVAKRIGLEGPMTATHAGDALRSQLEEIGLGLGAYPHASLNYTKHHKPQSTRLIKVEALTCCGYVARVTRSWLNTGLLMCPHGKKLREV